MDRIPSTISDIMIKVWSYLLIDGDVGYEHILDLSIDYKIYSGGYTSNWTPLECEVKLVII